MEYSDKASWPETADGDGFYLELVNINSDNSLASNWRASSSEVLSTNVNNSNFIIYPNPTEDKLFIKSNRTIKKNSIFNLLNPRIKTIEVNFKSGEINISELHTGVYFLSLRRADNTNISTKIFKK